MVRIARPLVCLVAALLMTATANAQEKPKQRAAGAKRAANAQVFQLPKTITLTEEQQAKLKALQEEYSAKWAAALKKQNEILTPEQRTARAEANKANREAKKSGKEAQEAVMAALKLTDEQKAKWEAAQKEVAELRKEIEQKKRELLTPEQKEKLRKRQPAK